MTTNSANLLLENLVVESGLKLSLSAAGCGDIHSCLTTSENDKVLVGGDGCAVQGSICDVCLHDLEIRGVDELGGLVFRGGNEVSAVWRPLKIHDLGYDIHLVDLDVIQLLTTLLSLADVPSPHNSNRTFASYCDTDPSSWPAMMYFDR